MKNTALYFRNFRFSRNGSGNFIRIQKLFSIVVLAGVVTSSFAVAAQTRPVNRGSQGRTQMPTVQTGTKGAKLAAKAPVAPGGSTRKGGWSGVINYEQSLDVSDTWKSPVTGKGHSSREKSHNLSYEGRMIVDGSDPQAVVARGTVEYSNLRRLHENTVIIDACHAFNDEHEFVIDDRVDDTETGRGAGQAESFYLYTDEARGTYSLSFTFPKVPGKWSRESHRKSSGHCQPKNNEPIDSSDSKEILVEGRGGRAENQIINPNEPDVLQGSITIDNNEKNRPDAIKVPVIKISWKLRRDPPPLIITDVKFYHLRYPSPNTWEEIEDDNYTIDGNDVKVVATIVNLSGSQKSATVNFKELKENVDLPQGKVAASFEPHEEKAVEYIWDTSGYAWHEAQPWNKSEIFRRVEVRIPDDSKIDELEVRPKPVVVVPGLWSKPEAFGKFIKYFNSNPNEPWAVQLAPIYPTKAAGENAKVIDKTVRALQEKENAWHVDLAAHSTGGLAARAYVDSRMPTQYDGRPTATHLVMMGTPNMGTPCATGVDNIITRIFSRNPEAFGELSLKNMSVFNQAVKLRHGTKFSILVGNSVPQTCQLDLPGDGITTQRLAVWTIKDWKSSTVAARHEDMPGEQANFMQVYKWLAVPPKGDHAPDNAQASNINALNETLAFSPEVNFGKRNYGAMFQPASFNENGFGANISAGDDEPEPNFATGLKLAANGSSQIEIPITNGSRFSIVLFAPPNVSAVLIDDKGETLGKSLAGDADALGAFRTITVKKPFQNGLWKLRLESRDTAETEIVVTGYIDYNSKLPLGN
jgi:hypothetical protein